tara:strand:+ start:2549 stop:3145 length:597 start_codon:yes stop_codon:yes gene_type:complete
MASNKFKFNKRILSQITLLLLGVIIIFFTYFYAGKDRTKKTVEVKEKEITEEIQNKNTFENIKYEGVDASGNQFVINSEYAEFENETPNLIDMRNILCNFYFKDGTVLKITSDFGVYDNLTNDMSFEQNVKMFYLESKLFSEKANFVNSENYLFVEGNVIAEGLEGNLKADKMNFDLTKKKLRISMYNQDKVNIKVNY